MPVFNGEKFLKKSIGSILNQTYRNFELIILDDGSTDSSKEIILSNNDNRIIYYSNASNKGLVYTRNKLVELSQGKYIAIMDCDDIAEPYRLEKQVVFLETHPKYALVGGGTTYIDYKDEISGEFVYDAKEEMITSILLFNNYFAQSTVMLRRSMVPNNPYRLDYAEDYELWVRLSNQYKVSNLREKLIKYRINQHGTSRCNNDKMNNEIRIIIKNQITELIPHISEKELELHYLLTELSLTNRSWSQYSILESFKYLQSLYLSNANLKKHHSKSLRLVLRGRYFRSFDKVPFNFFYSITVIALSYNSFLNLIDIFLMIYKTILKLFGFSRYDIGQKNSN